MLITLKDGFDNNVLRNPNKILLNAIVNVTIRLANPNLYELLIEYLSLVGTDEAKSGIDKILQQYNYGDVAHEHTTDNSRVKREWDTTDSSYNLVASYYDRRSDVRNYPTYASYLTWRNYGINKLYLQVGVGTFSGAYCSGSTKRLKLFNKAAARGFVLGNAIDMAHLEYTESSSGSYRYQRIYVKLGPTVYVNTDKSTYVGGCLHGDENWWHKSKRGFSYRFSYFVYVATINFDIYGTVSTRADGGICVCPARLAACAKVTPSVTLRVTGGGSVNLFVSTCIYMHMYVYIPIHMRMCIHVRVGM